MAHYKYKCQSCKEAFKTTKILDEHIKTKHTEPNKSTEYNCDKCDSTFTAIHYLRIHVAKQHVNVNTSKQAEINCEFCDFVIKSLEQMVKHKEQCRGGFQEVRTKVCKFFVSGSGCWKGQECRFSHPQTKHPRDAPVCKNG
jgi:DNA-directed RNA polymerase subunit RPC12/RpoP